MDPKAKNGTIYEFDGFQLITDEELLLRKGRRIPLNSKSFNVLRMLVERHGHLVTKSEIIDAVWEDAFVEEGSLAKAIWATRQALEDTSKDRFIQTVPRRGYRFVFPVSVCTTSSGAFRLSELGEHVEAAKEITDESIKPAATGAVSESRRRSVPRWAAIVGIVLVIAGSLAIYLGINRQGSLSKEKPTRLVVMPLRPLDRPGSDTIYDLGIAEALISKLRPDKNLSVLQLETVRIASDDSEDPVKIGIDRNADYVLSSHYQLANGKIKVTAKLIDVSSRSVEEYFSITTQAEEPFAAQETIADDIGNRILARFGSGSSDFRDERGTSNEEAYRSYLLAMNFGKQRLIQDVQKAAVLYDRAVQLDPNFALAWAAKALNHRYLASYAGADVHDQYRKSVEAVDKALSIDPNLAAAYAALCHIKNRYEYDFVGAEAACRRAVELDPRSAEVQNVYSNFLYSRGRFEEAIEAARKAIDLQPLAYDNHQTLGLALYFSRRHAEEEAEWRRLLELNPNHGPIYEWLARSLVRQGKEAEALSILIERAKVNNPNKEAISRLEEAYAKAGWHGVTMERIKLAEASSSPNSFQLACLYATIGNSQKALENLEKAYRQRSNMIAVLKVEPQLDALRDDPRYGALVQKIENN